MACILHIETSTDICSVALSENGACLYHEESRPDAPVPPENGGRTRSASPNHAVKLAPMVADAVSFADSHAIPIDAVAVSKGPGSYTGLRIGVSEAKGVCYGRQLKLISVPTLQLLCVPVLLEAELPDDALLCPMIDARRMEVYASLFDRALHEVRPTAADIVTGDTYKDFLDARPVYFFGNGAAKCQAVINHPNAHFLDNVEPLAQWMFPLAERAWVQHSFEDVAYFEPFYLKEFAAGKKALG